MPDVVKDEEHYRHDNCRLKSKLPPIPKLNLQKRTPKNASVSMKTPKKSRINYRDIDSEYCWGPGFGLPPHAKNNLQAGFKRLQYISQKYIDYTPLAKQRSRARDR